MQNLNLRQLEAFTWVAQLGSFRAAATRLNMTQPAISQRVADLEATLGVTLLERSSRACRLTPRGRAFEPRALQLLELARAIQADVANRKQVHGLVKIGVADSVAITWLPEILRRIETSFPDLAVEIEVDLTVSLARRLATGQLDLVCGIAGLLRERFEVLPLGRIALAWMASPKLRIRERIATPETLVTYPIIGHTGGYHQSLMQRWFRMSGRTPRRLSNCNSLATIIDLTVAGAGLSILPPKALSRLVRAGKLRVVPSRPAVPANELAVAFDPKLRSWGAGGLIELIAQTAARHPAIMPP